MNILLTGAAGYIGSHVAKIAARGGHTVVAVDNLTCGHEWAVRWGPLERGDITDHESAALNLGTGTGHSVREVIATVASISGRSVPVREAAPRAGDPPVLVADACAASRLLGWQPAYPDLQTIVRHAWEWHGRATERQLPTAPPRRQ